MDIINEFIGERIRKARREKKLSQQDLASHLKRSIGAISQLEKDVTQVSAIDVFEIAKLFDKPIEYFFGEEFLEMVLNP